MSPPSPPSSSRIESISVVVPVYHNALSLPDLVSRLRAVADANPQWRWEWIFVDDGSRDESARVLKDLQQTEPRVTVVSLSRNVGSNRAVMAGLSVAQGVAVGVISADLQDPPELLAELFDRWQRGTPLVLATRTARHDAWWVTLGANLFYHLLRWLALPRMPVGGFDFCVLDRTAVDELRRRNRAVYLAGEIVSLNLPFETIAYTRQARAARYGRSMWTFAKRGKLAWLAIALYSRIPPGGWIGCGIAAVYIAWVGFTDGTWSSLGNWLVSSAAIVIGSGCIGLGVTSWSLRQRQTPAAETWIATVYRSRADRESAAA